MPGRAKILTPKEFTIAAFAVVLVVTILLLANTGLSGQQQIKLAEYRSLVLHTMEVLASLDEVQSFLIDAETGQRGYIITGDEAFLEPYRVAKQQLPSSLQRVTRLTQGDDFHQKRLEEVARLKDEKLTELAETIALRRVGGFSAAQPIVSTGVGKKVMDRLRAILADMKADEQRLLQERIRAMEIQSSQTSSLMLAFRGVSVCFLLLVAWLLSRVYTARQQDEVRMNELNKLLERNVEELREQGEIIALVHDAIFCRDKDNLITYWNKGAEQLYGWSAEEALGKSPHDLLKTQFPIPLEQIESFLNRDGHWDGELIHTRRDGSILTTASRWSRKCDPGGNLIALIESNSDITALRQLTKQLDDQLAEVSVLNSELTAARDQAQSASKLKSEFVANMSHEIRTPMNGIIGMCNVLLKTNIDTRQRDYANNIKETSNALLSVINDILDFSKIEAGRIELEIVDFDPVRIVEGTSELLATHARNKQLSLMSFIAPSMPQRLRGDPERLRQVLINLVSNAIKFSDHGEIAVSAEVASVETNIVNVRFSVVDHGIGLTPEERHRLFQPFVQADGSISRRFGGTGLGLSISKRLIELMGGTIGLDSAKGEGSTFWFVVPLERRSDVPVVTAKNELQNVRVLIVDDEPHARDILHSYVGSWGMRNDVAGDAEEALRLLQQANLDGNAFQIAIIDLLMPGKNGIELAKSIFNDSAISSTKLILLTAFDAPGVGKLAIELGFKAYITKPVRQSQLLDCLTQIVCGGRTIITKSAIDARKTVILEPERAIGLLVLIAEDHPINQQVAQIYLDEMGLASRIVNNGKEAVEAIANANYTVVLMDCQMPEMDGFSATNAIRKTEALTGQHIPIIAMTAHAMEGDRERCLAAGMDDYISKPIDPDQLRNVIEKWLPSSFEELPSSFEELRNDERSVSQLCSETKNSIDLDSLAQRFGPHNVATFLKLFLDDAPRQLAELRTAAETGDCVALLKILHGFKGVCASVFAHEMKQTCAALETSARDNDSLQISLRLEQLEAEFQGLREFLETSSKSEGGDV
jgi:two-component system sensor histidine kinase/response regulator